MNAFVGVLSPFESPEQHQEAVILENYIQSNDIVVAVQDDILVVENEDTDHNTNIISSINSKRKRKSIANAQNKSKKGRPNTSTATRRSSPHPLLPVQLDGAVAVNHIDHSCYDSRVSMIPMVPNVAMVVSDDNTTSNLLRGDGRDNFNSSNRSSSGGSNCSSSSSSSSSSGSSSSGANGSSSSSFSETNGEMLGISGQNQSISLRKQTTSTTKPVRAKANTKAKANVVNKQPLIMPLSRSITGSSLIWSQLVAGTVCIQGIITALNSGIMEPLHAIFVSSLVPQCELIITHSQREYLNKRVPRESMVAYLASYSETCPDAVWVTTSTEVRCTDTNTSNATIISKFRFTGSTL